MSPAPRAVKLLRVPALALAVIAATGFAHAAGPLHETLHPYLARYELPALAAAVVRNGRVVASGAVGTRRAGANVPVALGDRFHLGSDTNLYTTFAGAPRARSPR